MFPKNKLSWKWIQYVNGQLLDKIGLLFLRTFLKAFPRKLYGSSCELPIPPPYINTARLSFQSDLQSSGSCVAVGAKRAPTSTDLIFVKGYAIRTALRAAANYWDGNSQILPNFLQIFFFSLFVGQLRYVIPVYALCMMCFQKQ
jgi:hypothetical protein